MVSIGDHIYAKNTPVLAGVITGINRTTNVITINSTIAGATPPANGDYIMALKNNVAESNGVRGCYIEFEITNYQTVETELFAVKSEVFKKQLRKEMRSEMMDIVNPKKEAFEESKRQKIGRAHV